MKNYFVLDGEKIPMSDEIAKSLKEQQAVNYQQKVKDWLISHYIFPSIRSWKIISTEKIVRDGGHANSEMIIKLGQIQNEIQEFGYFGGNKYHTLYLNLKDSPEKLKPNYIWSLIYCKLIKIKFA